MRWPARQRVIYSMNYLDLKETRPLVVAAPANVIGMFTDFFQRTITDVGLIGPDRARGGLYLLLPPDYDGQIPQGYFAFKSPTYNVFLFFRTIMPKGDNGPDPKPAVAAAEQTRIYPLWTPEKDVKPMVFPNGSGKRVDMMYPVDNAYWTKLKQFVDYEPVAAIDPELRGVLASIGIIKGQPFSPTARQQELLKKAVETAPRMIMALRQLGRPDGRELYYKDRQYQNTWASGTAEWLQDGYLDVNQRASYFQIAYSTASAMGCARWGQAPSIRSPRATRRATFSTGRTPTSSTCRRIRRRRCSGPSLPTTSPTARWWKRPN
jgi:hypothetical protein